MRKLMKIIREDAEFFKANPEIPIGFGLAILVILGSLAIKLFNL